MSPFRVEYPDHAKQRLKQRAITRQQVRICITDGTLTAIDLRGRRIKNLYIAKRILEVVYVEEPSGVTIVTAYWKGRFP